MSVFFPTGNMDLHDRTIIGRTMHHGIFRERLQDQFGNEAGEQFVILNVERIFETSCISDAEDGKIIFQIFQLFLHGDIFVLIRERILKKTAERLDSVTDDLVIVHGCHKAQTV